MEDYIKASEVCERLKITKETLRRWVNLGAATQYKIGTGTFYRKSELLPEKEPEIHLINTHLSTVLSGRYELNKIGDRYSFDDGKSVYTIYDIDSNFFFSDIDPVFVNAPFTHILPF